MAATRPVKTSHRLDAGSSRLSRPRLAARTPELYEPAGRRLPMGLSTRYRIPEHEQHQSCLGPYGLADALNLHPLSESRSRCTWRAPSCSGDATCFARRRGRFAGAVLLRRARPPLCQRTAPRVADKRRQSWSCYSAHQFLPNIGICSSCIPQGLHSHRSVSSLLSACIFAAAHVLSPATLGATVRCSARPWKARASRDTVTAARSSSTQSLYADLIVEALVCRQGKW